MKMVPVSFPGCRAVVCEVCGFEFGAIGAGAWVVKTCSRDCHVIRMNERVRRNYRELKGIGPTKDCPQCGKVFEFSGTNRRYCSSECLKEATVRRVDQVRGTDRSDRVCRICGNTFPYKGKATMCSSACKKAHLDQLNIARKYFLMGTSQEQVSREKELGCRICGDKWKPQVDHDHITGAYRGILCTNHNTGIGKMGDNYQDVMRAAEYLVESLDVLKMAEKGQLS